MRGVRDKIKCDNLMAMMLLQKMGWKFDLFCHKFRILIFALRGLSFWFFLSLLSSSRCLLFIVLDLIELDSVPRQT